MIVIHSLGFNVLGPGDLCIMASTRKNNAAGASKVQSNAGASKEDSENVLASMQQSLEKAMVEMGRVGKLLTSLQADISEIKDANVGLRTDMDSVLLRLNEAENRISQLEDEKHDLRQKVDKTAMKCEDLHQAVEDAANRDRRQNLRLIGLKEKLENGKPSECVKKIISEALGIELDGSQLQRVHRAPVAIPKEGSRPIIIRFLSFLERERVLAAAKKTYNNKEEVVWKRCKLSFFPDMTRETAEKRRKFKDVRIRLHGLDVRFTLAYPAEIRFTWRGKRMKFTDDREAMDFLNKESEKQRSPDGMPVQEPGD